MTRRTQIILLVTQFILTACLAEILTHVISIFAALPLAIILVAIVFWLVYAIHRRATQQQADMKATVSLLRHPWYTWQTAVGFLVSYLFALAYWYFFHQHDWFGPATSVLVFTVFFIQLSVGKAPS